MSFNDRSQVHSVSVAPASTYDNTNEINLATKGQGQRNDGDNALLFTNVVEIGDDNKELEENTNSSQAETEEASCKSVCKLLFRRNWFIIFFGTLLGFDVGFWIYLFTGYAQWIWACTILGFIFAFIIDEYFFSSGRNKDWTETVYVQDADIEKTFEVEEGCDFYVQTDIFSRFFRHFRGSSRVYHKNNNGCLVFERKYVFFFKDYQGYEIGSGCANAISAFFTPIIVLLLPLDSVIWPIILYFAIVFVFTVIGGFIELGLRSARVLSPVNGSITVSTPVPIHEIRDIQCVSIGYHTICTNLVEDQLGAYYYFVRWYRFLVNVGLFFIYVGKFIRINVILFLWLLVFLFTFLLFLLVISKDEKFLLQITLAGIWIVFFLHILFLAFLHTPFCGAKDVVRVGNTCELQKFSVERIPAGKQTSFFYILLMSCIAVFVAAICLSVVQESIYHEAETFFTEAEQSVIISKKMVCEGSEFGSGGRRLLQVNLFNELCDSPMKELLILAVVCMCISWNILLFLAFWWSMVDQYFVLRKSEPPPVKKWHKYTQFYITRARNRKYQLLAPTIVIDLGEEQAMHLMTYLTKVCPYAQLPSTIGLSYDGGFQYVNRFGAIGGQPFGNGNGGGGGGRGGNDGGGGGRGRGENVRDGGYHNVSSVMVGDGRRI